MKRSVLIAIVLMAALVSWFILNTFVFSQPSERASENVEVSEAARGPIEVRVQNIFAAPHIQSYEFQGRTEPDREVTVKASTSGAVIRADVEEGQSVTAGTLLCGLDVEARQARVAEAQAVMRAKQLDADAARTLAERGWASATSAAGAEAAVEAAQAAVNTARVELNKTLIRAPFDGVFEMRHAELGDFLTPGAPCGVIVDLDPLVIAIQVTEQHLRHLELGMPVEAQLETGEKLTGTIRFIAQVADPVTRTLKVEAAIDATESNVVSGVSIRLRIAAETAVEASRLPASLLSLSDSGAVGVRHVVDNEVVFSYARVIDESGGEVWVTGLPARASVLVAGQGFIATGTAVTSVDIEG